MTCTININIVTNTVDTSVKADFPLSLNTIEGIKALEGALAYINDRVDAKARANGFSSAKDAPIEFTGDLTFNDIL